MLRSLVCAFVGHVDHGKTSIQDYIRGTAVVESEAGRITQCISCTKISFDIIRKICKDFEIVKKIRIPGLLFLDTPGHAFFTNLRKRGGSLADLAILVIDVNEGFKPQTIEAIEILKGNKTPFIIAANKIDLIPGWKEGEGSLLERIKHQSETTRNILERKLYELVGSLYEHGFNSERFDKVDDYTKQIAIVPTSARTGAGIPELLMVITGLAQKFLEKNLEVNIEKQGKATILEIKEERGLGITLDIILYEGKIKINDKIIIGDVEKPIITKVRSLLEPSDGKLKAVNEVTAATTVKLTAPELKGVIAGMPLRVANEDIEKIKKEVKAEIDAVLMETDKKGVVVKADSLGSLEALVNLLRNRGIKIRRIGIGEINKNDINEALAEKGDLNKVILGFNIKKVKAEIPVIAYDIIYKIIDDYEVWRKAKELELEEKELENVTRPCKIQILAHCIFRQSNPAVVGVEVLAGKLTNKIKLIKENGNKIGSVKSMQKEGDNIDKAIKGEQVAISLPDVTVGRHIFEGTILYSDLSEEEYGILKKLKKYLKDDEVEALKEILQIKRKDNIVWGV